MSVALSRVSCRGPFALERRRTRTHYSVGGSYGRTDASNRNESSVRDWYVNRLRGSPYCMTKIGTSTHHCRQAMTTVEASLLGGRVEAGLLPDEVFRTGPAADGKEI